MRRFLSGLFLASLCGVSHAAGVVIDPKMALGPLGLDSPGQLSGLPAITIDVPLPEGLEASLPTVTLTPENGLQYTPGERWRGYPELPGLNGLSGLDVDIELPGLDGLPIQAKQRVAPDVPLIPGIDGLPLGFGRR